MNKDFTTSQKDYALYLPAISTFYTTHMGKYMHDECSIENSRFAKNIPDLEMLNFLDKNKGIFNYKWGLYSAGHANLDLTKTVSREEMIRSRDRNNTVLLADSGGFQIAKGVWEADWKNFDDKAKNYRETVLKWLCTISDYSMTLDIPTWTCTNQESADKTNIRTVQDAINTTVLNHEYFMEHSFNDAKFLNVLQGSNHTDADEWYEIMKEYNDPKKHDKFFRGWAMGGANMADPHLILKRIVTIIHDGLLETGKHDWMHFLGMSKLDWSVMFTDIQRAVRKYHNPNFTISFDAASPFLTAVNACIFRETKFPHLGKWTYSSDNGLDDRKYAKDTRNLRDAILADGIFDNFEDSPVSEILSINDICHYAPGDVNLRGEEGVTSWDSYSYMLVMAHNVCGHINAVQRANRRYDSGIVPKVLFDQFTGETVRDLINRIFAEPDYDKRMQIIDDSSRFWMQLPGARGLGGKKAANKVDKVWNNLFEEA